MQLMYVVDLQVEGDGGFQRVVGHVAEWLSGHGVQLDPAEFEVSGARELAVATTPGGAFGRHADWEVVEVANHLALKLVVSQVVDTDVKLTTRVTVADIDGVVRFRIGISRQNTSQRLIPVGATDIYQPGILRSLDQDEHLVLRARGQLVNGRYIPVRTTAEARAVAEILPSEDRLPLALIHVRSTETWDLARELSRKMLGLVRTVTVNFQTAHVLAAEHSEAHVPFGGLAIVWPGLGAPSLNLSAERLRELGAQEVRRILMQRLGAIAALSNGADTAWRRVRASAQNARMTELSEQAERAREGGDKEGEITALQEQVEALQTEKAELETIGEDALQQADTSARLARQLEAERNQARVEAQMWQNSHHSLSAGKSVSGAEPLDPWAAIPELKPHSDPEQTFLAITDAASETIVFTERARKSWANIDYPEAEDMTKQLVLLARAAVVLYDGEEKRIPHMNDWFKENFGLTVALTDQTITKRKKKEMRWLNNFEHEGERLNATPHVKVRDAVKFNECGRIHFALDATKERLVIQHVGIKTYK